MKKSNTEIPTPYRDAFVLSLQNQVAFWQLIASEEHTDSKRAREINVLIAKTRAFLSDEFGEGSP